MIGDVPAGHDHVLQVDTAPAHHPVALEFGAGLDQRRQLGFLLGGQPSRCSRRLAVDQSLGTCGIEAVYPVAQGLPIHRANLGRRGPILALIGRRDRQQPASLVSIFHLPGCRPYPFRVPIRAQCHRRRHRASPEKSRLPESTHHGPRESSAVGHLLRRLVLAKRWPRVRLPGVEVLPDRGRSAAV